jgi:uncharacterized cupredoxin-like copper-binding protein
VPRRPTLPLAALLASVVLLASACSLADLAGSGPDRPGGDGRPAPATSATRVPKRKPGPAWATGAPVRVVMNDRFRYRPAAIMIRAGRRVTFEVTNAGRLPHEFILGDRAAQLAHERQMRDAPPAGGHAHDHGPGGHASPEVSGALTVPPGQTRRLTWTFDEPGTVLYGCHVLGHWAAGMKGTIVVLAPDRPLPRPALAPLPRRPS